LRDILTVLASLVILVLAAALIAPPLMDWEARRDWIDQAISTASGTPARTQGRIVLRLLPSPRLEVDTLRLGGDGTAAPSLEAKGFDAEIELPPLLRGEVRFREARAAGAELRLPVDPAAAWPTGLKAGPAAVRDWSIQNLAIDRLLVTTFVPATGRTDQFAAEGVTVEGQKLAGPWRVEGRSRGVPFRLVTGELTPEGMLAVKLAGGGDRVPRFDVDAQAALGPAADPKIPRLTGTARVAFGPPAQAPAAGFPIPVTVQAAFKAAGSRVELDQITIEGGEGAASLRLAGTGQLRLDDPRLALTLEGRRLDLDTILAALAANEGWQRLRATPVPALPMPIDLAVTVGSVTLAQEDIADATLRASLAGDRISLGQLAFTAPAPRGSRSRARPGSRRSVLERARERHVGVLRPARPHPRPARPAQPLPRRARRRPFEASADLALAAPVTAFRNAGSASATRRSQAAGATPRPRARARGRLEAQLAVQGLDLPSCPRSRACSRRRAISTSASRSMPATCATGPGAAPGASPPASSRTGRPSWSRPSTSRTSPARARG
jgi:hypothetical protein